MQTERAILAGGCFWGMQDLIRKQDGVLSTRVGYIGGTTQNPKYEDVKTGSTGHAEAIEVVFDPDITSFRDILALFFQIHDPTTIGRQGNDIGSQYRSAIFYTSPDQQAMSVKTIQDVEISGLWPAKVVTEVVEATEFWEAEDYHQDYLENLPDGYTCHFPRADWVLPSN